jgi:hypothetical protein
VNSLPVEMEQLKFTVECIDGTTLYPSGIEELLRFPNSKTREIQTIEIASSYKTESRCTITFSNDILGPVCYTVSGEDSYVVSTTDAIEHHLESMSDSGPHFISSSFFLQESAGPLLLSPAGLLTAFGFLLCWTILVNHKHIYIGSFMFSGFTSATILTSGLVLLSVAIKFERLLRHFFPKVSFCIGGGDVRHQRMIENRRLFGLAALVTLAIGILGSWVANMLPTH